MRYIILLLLTLTACTAYGPSNTTVTVDYFGVRESHSGLGWDNPLNVERLYLAEVKPLVVLYGTVNQKETESLITDMIMKGWKPKVWVLDKQNPVTQLLQTLQDANVSEKPTLVYESKSLKRIIIGKKNISTFLKRHSFALLDINNHDYY